MSPGEKRFSGNPLEKFKHFNMSITSIKPFHISGEHSYHRRSNHHDYFAPFIYHIILKKTQTCRNFSRIVGDARIKPGLPGCASAVETELGTIIAKAIIHLPYAYPTLKPLQFVVMPDHVHLLLQVLYRSGRNLDFYMEFLMKRIADKYAQLKHEEIVPEDIFQRGYCDKPLYDNRSLDGWYVYIKLNPHRLAARLQYPQFFQRIHNLKIGDKEYEVYGNPFLFRNPDKYAVKISRNDSLEQKAEKKALWISEASKGSVLVSPFVSKEEKAVRAEAERAGGSIILITYEVFSERFKPSDHNFDLCSQGRLLIISLGLPHKTPLTREICERMNALAETVAIGDYSKEILYRGRH